MPPKTSKVPARPSKKEEKEESEVEEEEVSEEVSEEEDADEDNDKDTTKTEDEEDDDDDEEDEDEEDETDEKDAKQKPTKKVVPCKDAINQATRKNNYCIDISTSQVTSIKTLIEALKELLMETSIIFDETGIKIYTIDTSHIVIIHMKLEASEFERFYCEKPISIGVNMINLYKIIKTINNGDTLTFFMDPNERFGMDSLGIKIENGVKNTKSTYYLDLYELDPEHIQIDPIEYNSIITIPSNDFQKLIRDMHNLSQNVEIRNIGNQLVFRCKGEFCELETIWTDNPTIDENTNEVKRNIIIYNKNQDKITQGLFNLKFLSVFTKCTNLSSTVELNIENDYPLIVYYNIATLGQIRFCIAPTIASK